MKPVKPFQGDSPAGPEGASPMGSFAQYVESQACRMEQCGWPREARNLRGWAIELRSSGIEAEFTSQEPLLPRS